MAIGDGAGLNIMAWLRDSALRAPIG